MRFTGQQKCTHHACMFATRNREERFFGTPKFFFLHRCLSERLSVLKLRQNISLRTLSLLQWCYNMLLWTLPKQPEAHWERWWWRRPRRRRRWKYRLRILHLPKSIILLIVDAAIWPPQKGLRKMTTSCDGGRNFWPPPLCRESSKISKRSWE